MRDADDEVARCAAAVAEVDDAVRTHATLTAELERLADERAEAAKRLAAARTAAEEVAALTQQLKQAEVVAAAAGATLEASVVGADRAAQAAGRRRRAHRDRRRTGNRCRAGPRRRTDRPARYSRPPRRPPKRRAQRCRRARTVSTPRAARVEQLTDRDEADRLATPAGQDRRRHCASVEHAERELASIALTDELMRDIETAAAAVERAAGQAELASAHIEVVAAADIELRVGGEAVMLRAGGTWSAERHHDRPKSTCPAC